MNKKELYEQIITLFTFYGLEVSAEHLKIYYELLKDYSDEQIKTSIKNIMLNEKNPPRNFVPVIIDYIYPKLTTADAEEVIDRLKDMMIDIGRYRTPKLTPLYSQIVEDCGGWVQVCSMPTENLEWRIRNLFKSGYRATGKIYNQKGLHEIENREGDGNIKKIDNVFEKVRELNQ